MTGRAESARLEVRLFGDPSVHGPDGSVKLSPLQLALVAVVYGHRSKGVSRGRVAQLLWSPGANPETRHRLRQLLVEIRARVGRRIIETSGDLLRPGADVASDVEAFHHGLEGSSLLDSALMLARGFARLAGGHITDAYDDWRAATEATQLRRLGSQALKRWNRATGEGDWATAKDAAEALYTLDPGDPPAVLRMIEILGRLGQPESAEQLFTEYRAGLTSGREPSPELIDAVQRVRRLKEARPSVLGSPDREVPLFGRREALARARSVFDQVAAGDFGFVLIGGDSGIGKTRVLRELQREGILRDFRCLEAQAVELESRIPLNPLLDALEPIDLRAHLRAIGQPWDAVLRSMLTLGSTDDPVAAPPLIQDSALPRRLLDSVSLLFESLATERPTLVFLDDLQWADATTVACLQFMQRRWTRGSFGVIATIRPELVADHDDVAKYLSPRSPGLAINRIDLGELAAEDALQLVTHIGQGEIGQELGHRICALAGRHPLYLTELARDYLAGRLRLPELPVREVTIPVSLQQILDARWRHLTDPALKVAGILAVAARSMRVQDAGRLVGLNVDAAADAVDELRRARLIEYERDRVRIAHELFRSAIYRHLSEPRRAINHRAVAEHIQADATADASGELATHFSRAGESEMAAKYAWSAAERAMESGAAAEAAHFFQLVVDNDPDPVRRAEATGALARALHLTRDLNRANPLLELASSRLYAVGRPGEALRLEIKRVEGLAETGAASLADLLSTLERIKAQARERSDWEGVALALDAELHLLHRLGDVSAIANLFGEMRSISKVGSIEAVLLCSAGLALGVLFGDPEEALVLARQAVALAGEVPAYRLKALLRLMVVLQYRGMLELPESQLIVREARDLARKSGDVLARYSIENNLAVAILDAGDLEAAELQMARAKSLAGSAEMDLNRCIQANNRAELALAKREFRLAEAAYAEALSYTGPTTPVYLIDLVNAGMGLCALEAGNLSEAKRMEGKLSESPSRWHFDPTTILAFRVRLLRLGQSQAEAIELLEQAARDVDGRLVLAWLKIRALQVALLLRHDTKVAGVLAQESLRRAEELQLVHRVQEFRLLLARTRSALRSKS